MRQTIILIGIFVCTVLLAAGYAALCFRCYRLSVGLTKYWRVQILFGNFIFVFRCLRKLSSVRTVRRELILLGIGLAASVASIVSFLVFYPI
jgi:hypothetical protein